MDHIDMIYLWFIDSNYLSIWPNLTQHVWQPPITPLVFRSTNRDYITCACLFLRAAQLIIQCTPQSLSSTVKPRVRWMALQINEEHCPWQHLPCLLLFELLFNRSRRVPVKGMQELRVQKPCEPVKSTGIFFPLVHSHVATAEGLRSEHSSSNVL